MATTVTYKGQTLTTVDNQTKTLQTAGTWCEDDFTLTDVSGGGTGEWTTDGIATNAEPNGIITLGDSVTNIPAYGLAGAPITRCIAQKVTAIQQYAFQNAFDQVNGRIEPSDFPLLNNRGITGAFEQSYVTYVRMDGVLTNIAYAFRHCVKLVEIHLPNATGSIDRTCHQCDNLVIADLGSGNITNGSSFWNCSKLRTLVLRNTSGVQTLSAWNANCLAGIYNNPAESTIYVPQALISSYQTASNWSSAYSAGVTFTAIEGSVYDYD